MEVPRHWRLKKQRYMMEGIRVAEAQVAVGASGEQTVVTLGIDTAARTITGEVYSYAIVTDAPADFAEQAPYVMAMVKLDSGPMITAQLTDLAEEPAIGQPVEMVTRKLRTDGDAGVIVYGYKFRPVLA